MTDQPPEAPKDRRQRAAPTIDLTATDLSPAAAPEPPPAAEPPPKPEAVAAETPLEPAPRASRRALLLAGFAGALLVLITAAGAAWLAHTYLPQTQDAASWRVQIEALRKQVQELQSRPAPGADAKSNDALTARIAKIESDIAKLPPGDASIGERLTAADNAVKSLSVAVTALSQRGNDAAANAKQALDRADAAERATRDLQESVQRASTQASAAVAPAELATLTQRLAALEQSVQAARAQIAALATIDGAARLALSAAALRDAVEAGAPYAAELAQAKALGADAKVLAPLEPFTTAGLPSRLALAQELRDLLPALIKDANAGVAPAGFLERLQANAGKLVTVRPIDAPVGDDPATLLARLEAETARADVDGALADIAKLPPAARQRAAAWMDKAKARQAALTAAHTFAADSARALKPPSADALTKP